MEYIAWLLVPLALLVSLQYLLGPIMVYINQKIPGRYRFDLMDSEEFLSARGPVFQLLHDQIQEQGFRYVGSSELRMSHSVIYFSIYYSYSRKLACTLMTAHADHDNPVTQIEFTQMYSDGTLLNVNNNAVFGVYPEWDIKEAYRFPHVNDVSELLEMTEKIIRIRKPKAEALAMVEGKEFETIENHLNDEMDRLVRLGWVSSRSHDNEHKLTLKGAVLMTWKMCWPIKFILNKFDARRSVNVLKNATRP